MYIIDLKFWGFGDFFFFFSTLMENAKPFYKGSLGFLGALQSSAEQYQLTPANSNRHVCVCALCSAFPTARFNLSSPPTTIN